MCGSDDGAVTSGQSSGTKTDQGRTAGQSFADSITPSCEDDEQVREGESVRLSFNYTGVVNSFQLHRQNPGKGLEYILLVYDSGITTKADSSDLRFCAEADKENKCVELKLSSTKMTDTALYYCTLSAPGGGRGRGSSSSSAPGGAGSLRCGGWAGARRVAFSSMNGGCWETPASCPSPPKKFSGG
ncbi:UNVERIFIED_CONTAM: hypothetical protein FKN15_031387 [Acipenser sinensis]